MEATEGSPAHLSLESCKKVRAVRWLEAEEKTLIDEVLRWGDVLFGELKGVGIKPIGRRRSEAWAEIARTPSVRFSNASWSGDEVKKYFNLKQRNGVEQNPSTSEEASNEPRNKKRKIVEQVEATYKNMITDPERIIMETEKQKLEIKKLKIEINYFKQQDMAETVKIYHQLKIQQDCQLVVFPAQ